MKPLIQISARQGVDSAAGSSRPRVLVLTHRLPCPPDRGDRIRAYHLLRELSTRASVTLGAVSDEAVADHQRSELATLADRAVIGELSQMSIRRGAGVALVTGRALTPAALYRQDLADRLIQQHRETPFDTVVTFCSGMLGYAKALLQACDPDDRPRHILDLVDVDSLKWAGYAGACRGPMRLVYAAEAKRLRKAEAGGVVGFDALTVISEPERRAYREHVSTAIDPIVAGNGVDLQRFSIRTQPAAATKQPTIVFTGVLSYKPNADAVVWFARRVMPRVLAAVPLARFEIVGKSPSAAVRALDELPGVDVVGPVPDTVDYLRAAAVVVAPLQIAPGVQNKVLEAMACGRAIVCTWAAAAGIDATPGKHLIVADSHTDTARQVTTLLLNPKQRETLGQRARQRVEQRYPWSAQLAPLLDLIASTEPAHTIRTPLPRHPAAPAATLS